MKRKVVREEWKNHICNECRFATPVTDKEWNFSIEDHQPLTIACEATGAHQNYTCKSCYRFKSK